MKRRNLGLASGSLWLVLSSTAFAVGVLLMVRSLKATILLALLSVAAAVLIGIASRMLHTLTHMRTDPGQSNPSEGRRLLRQFGVIVALEGIALTGVTLACVLTHRWELIVPLNLIIVGLHFLPLARLFNVPRYNITGSLFCAIPILTMLLIPAGGYLGQAFVWAVIPSVGCAAVASLTAWAGLRDVGQFIRVSQAAT